MALESSTVAISPSLRVIQTAAFFRCTGTGGILVLDDSLGVAAVVLDVVEGQPADGPLHLEQVLEVEGDAVGMAHQQHIVR